MQRKNVMIPESKENAVPITGAVSWNRFYWWGSQSHGSMIREGISESLAQEMAPLGIKVTIVEPGRFRTDFAGRSIEMSGTLIDDYADTVGKRRSADEHICRHRGRRSQKSGRGDSVGRGNKQPSTAASFGSGCAWSRPGPSGCPPQGI